MEAWAGSGSVQGKMADSCKCGEELSGFYKMRGISRLAEDC
jgi:hypothetical protein